MSAVPPAASAAITIEGDRGWNVTPGPATGGPNLDRHQQATVRATVTLAGNVPLSTRPYCSRNGLQESRYTLSDPTQFSKPVAAAPLRAIGRYFIDGVPIDIRETVKRREAKLPYGDVLREVRSVPRIAVSVTPSTAIVPMSSAFAPDGWTAKPASQAFSFARSGERASFRFAVRPGMMSAQVYEIDAAAIDGLGEYREGYELVDHRDLELRYLYREATTTVRGVNVTTVAGLKVGYVMGVGDQVPMGLPQLGAQVSS